MFTDHYLEFLILAGVILIITDFFLQTDSLIVLGLGCFAFAITCLTGLPLLYQVLVLIAAWLGFIVLYYLFFKSLLAQFSNKVIAPDILDPDPMKRYIGQSSVVEVIEGRQMIRLDNEPVPFDSDFPLSPGDPVLIKAMTDGQPTVIPLPTEN
jgi:membrane protein implicated in regulation of membrane protease activity